MSKHVKQREISVFVKLANVIRNNSARSVKTGLIGHFLEDFLSRIMKVVTLKVGEFATLISSSLTRSQP